MRERVGRRTCAGWDAGTYNPDRDPDGTYATRIVGFMPRRCRARPTLTGGTTHMTEAKTIAVLPRARRVGSDEQLVAITEPLRDRGHRIVFVVDESFEGELERRGFEEALMRMAPAARAAGADRRRLGGVHPHDRARVPQADDRADRDGDRADLGRARGRRPVRPRPDAGDLGRGPARRRRDRQRDRLPGDPARGRPVGADRLREPARDAGRRHPPGVLRLRGGRPHGLGRVPRRVRAAAAARCRRRTRRSARRPAPARCPRASSSTSRRTSTCTSSRRLPTTRGRYRSARRGTGSARRCGRPTRTSTWPRRCRATGR